LGGSGVNGERNLRVLELYKNEKKKHEMGGRGGGGD